MRNLSVCFVFFALVVVTAYGQDQVAPSAQDGSTNVKPAAPAPDKDGAYQAGPGITPPVLTRAVAPQYPSADDQGPRRFRFLAVVGVDGSVKLRNVIPNNGSAYLENAIAAIKASTFQPGTLNGLPVPVLVCLSAGFSPFRPPSIKIVDCNQPGLGNGFGGTPPSELANDPLRLPPGAKPPTVVHSVIAEMSDDARRNHFEGIVLLSTVVDEQGMPTEIRVERSAGHGLDENAIAAVSQYRFRPATLDGKPIPARIRIEVSFRFRN